MTQQEVSAEIGRLLGLLFHSKGSLVGAVEELEHTIADWRAAITPAEKPDAAV
jgi:hypothetical protein